jgi:hypothetical protein|tara:strand:- start:5017 stop:5364 length:348 start_codon:yes stop_codon:yes gene_type:complete
MGEQFEKFQMKNTFLNRVSAERKVLRVVNKSVPRALQLTGLSSAAIGLWRGKIGFDRTHSIYPVLVNLAEGCQRLSDRSNETFLPLENQDAEAIERELKNLECEIGKLSGRLAGA